MTPPEFRPLPFLSNPHLQTILGTLLPGPECPPGQRHVVRLPDGDAILLAQHCLRQYVATAPMPVLGFTGSALEAIDRHAWPGNVRELQNRVKRAVILAEHPRITPADLDLPAEGAERDLDLRRARDRVERSIIDRALARCEGNLTATARLIGVSRPTLYDLLRHHGLRS